MFPSFANKICSRDVEMWSCLLCLWNKNFIPTNIKHSKSIKDMYFIHRIDVIKTTNKIMGHLWWNGTHLRYIIIIFWNIQPETISFIFWEFDNEQILLENSDTWFSSTANTRFNYICKMFVFCIFYVINCIVQLK